MAAACPAEDLASFDSGTDAVDVAEVVVVAVDSDCACPCQTGAADASASAAVEAAADAWDVESCLPYHSARSSYEAAFAAAVGSCPYRDAVAAAVDVASASREDSSDLAGRPSSYRAVVVQANDSAAATVHCPSCVHSDRSDYTCSDCP